MPAKKKIERATRATLRSVLKPLHDRWKASHRVPKGKVPDWASTPELKEQYRQLYQSAVKDAPGSSTVPSPTAEEIAAVVTAFWSK
jgi:hypothetical protein